MEEPQTCVQTQQRFMHDVPYTSVIMDEIISPGQC